MEEEVQEGVIKVDNSEGKQQREHLGNEVGGRGGSGGRGGKRSKNKQENEGEKNDE